MWKDFFYFSRRERRGILMLIALVAGVFLGKFLFTSKDATHLDVGFGLVQSSEKQEIVSETESKQNANSSSVSANQGAQSTSRPNLREEERTYYYAPSETSVAPRQNRYPVVEKFAEGTVISLNSSDTTQLMKIPGIGSSFAKRITSYRNLLGGFYRVEQLREVYGMYEELYVKIAPYLKTEAGEITLIQANTASLEKLRAHPYINFYQAKTIVEIRKRKGKLESMDEFSLLEEFSEEDLARIKHYLAF